VTRYLVDKSALARLHNPAVEDRLLPLIERGLVGICGVTEIEMLFSARNMQERMWMKQQLVDACEPVATPDDLWRRAVDIQEALTEKGQHRSAGVADLVIAATAQVRRLTVLHYDRDFDTIAAFTEQPVEWIVPARSVP
jgi:predicted nucleic acid-binding protein